MYCTFRHRKRNGETKYSYSKAIQSANLTNMRSIERTLALPNLILTDQQLRYMGIKAEPGRAVDKQGVLAYLILSLEVKTIESVIS